MSDIKQLIEGCCACGDKHADEAVGSGHVIGEQFDPAGRSLAEALQISFRLLSAIMFVLVVAYLFSGLFIVESDQRAVIVRFGRLLGDSSQIRGDVLQPGLHFSWPYPIDAVITVPTNQQTVEIDTFWHFEAPGESVQRREELRASSEGLRPGFDGALMTGDRGLIHVKWQCKYQVPTNDDQAVLDYIGNVRDVQGLLATAIENASICVAAAYDVETIWRSDRDFASEVQNQAQQLLNQQRVGLQIRQLQYADQTPPLQTVQAFNQVTMAEQERSKKITEANQQATEIKVAAAGRDWQLLAEAIHRYDLSLSIGDAGPIAEGQDAIDALLMDKDTTKGQASEVINSAMAYKTAVVQRARQAEDQFQKLLPAYKANPEMMISRLWTQTKQEILSREKVWKTYLPAGTPLVFYITPDPKLVRRSKLSEAAATEEQVKGPRPPINKAQRPAEGGGRR